VSPPGNLYASTLVRVNRGDPPPPTLALVAAVALDQVVGAYAGEARVRIKWPNDLMAAVRSSPLGGGGMGEAHDGGVSPYPRAGNPSTTGFAGGPPPPMGEDQGWAKLSGILLESEGDAVVIGFGVNLAHHPEGLDRPTASLVAIGIAPPSPDDFLAELAAAFAQWLARWRGEGLEPVRRRWLARAHPIGTPLTTSGVDGERLVGLFDGLDATGALRLRLADGAVHVMHAGDVFLL
jgi:BirA family transcriptional regulator, biotin operon repressor / biotin---[acetyl-CoA-carboxylase] ligase